jgi:cytochrome d ubiquinol oxidase subunit II
MATIWFCLLTAALAVYVVLDGFDLGAGVVHLLAAREEPDRQRILRSIGPVWLGNEVWLVATGATLYFVFPKLYSASFSGFYLPLVIVLWLLVLRGISIEFRNHVESVVWRPLWDAVFAGASLLLAFFFGTALGNVIRGVPLDASGSFFEPLWADAGAGGRSGILDTYTLCVGLLAVAALGMHGALWIAVKTDGSLQARARRIAGWAWPGVLGLTAIVTVWTFNVQPQLAENLARRPWGYAIPALAVASLAASGWLPRKRVDRAAFVASSTFLAAMIASAAFGIYPFVLPASGDPAFGLTAEGAAAPKHSLEVGLLWWIPGMVLAGVYAVFAYHRFRGKIRVEEPGYGSSAETPVEARR